jgi:hypothetical protein
MFTTKKLTTTNVLNSILLIGTVALFVVRAVLFIRRDHSKHRTAA